MSAQTGHHQWQRNTSSGDTSSRFGARSIIHLGACPSGGNLGFTWQWYILAD